MPRTLQLIAVGCALAAVSVAAFVTMGTPHSAPSLLAIQVSLGFVCFILGRATTAIGDAGGRLISK